MNQQLENAGETLRNPEFSRCVRLFWAERHRRGNHLWVPQICCGFRRQNGLRQCALQNFQHGCVRSAGCCWMDLSWRAAQAPPGVRHCWPAPLFAPFERLRRRNSKQGWPERLGLGDGACTNCRACLCKNCPKCGAKCGHERPAISPHDDIFPHFSAACKR